MSLDKLLTKHKGKSIKWLVENDPDHLEAVVDAFFIETPAQSDDPEINEEDPHNKRLRADRAAERRKWDRMKSRLKFGIKSNHNRAVQNERKKQEEIYRKLGNKKKTIIRMEGETAARWKKRVNLELDQYIIDFAAELGLEHGQAFVDKYPRFGTRHPFDSDYRVSEEGMSLILCVSEDDNKTIHMFYYKANLPESTT